MIGDGPQVQESTTSAAIGSAGAIRNITGVVRTVVDQVGNEIADLHVKATEDDLRSRAAVKARNGVRSLLRELAMDRGMSWSDVARLANVSVSAVRKWRTGGEAGADKRWALAQLAAFLDLLGELAVEDPVQWMEMNLALPEGYSVRPVDLYAEGHVIPLLEIAGMRRAAVDVLDQLDLNWRDARRSDFEVFMASDGQLALRERAGGR